jgi:hypothetical protein
VGKRDLHHTPDLITTIRIALLFFPKGMAPIRPPSLSTGSGPPAGLAVVTFTGSKCPEPSGLQRLDRLGHGRQRKPSPTVTRPSPRTPQAILRTKRGPKEERIT